MKLIKYIILLSLLITSCYDDILVDKNKFNSMTTIRVLDNDNNPIQNAKVTLDNNQKYQKIYNTNKDGEVSIYLNEGAHSIIVIAYKNDLYYTLKDNVAIIGGLEQTFVYQPLKNITEYLRIKVFKSHNEVTPIYGVKVALLKDKNYENFMSTQNPDYDFLIKNILFEGKTDENGMISFSNVPKYYNFKVLLYYSKSDFSFHFLGIAEEFTDLTRDYYPFYFY